MTTTDHTPEETVTEPAGVPSLSDPVRPVSNSELQTYKRCRRKWWLKYHRQLKARALNPASALASGTRVHRALAGLYVPDGETRQDPREVLERAIVEDWTAYTRGCQVAGQLPDELTTRRFTADTQVERAMVEGYVAWLEETGADFGLRVVAPETYLEVPFDLHDDTLPPVKLIGKLDVRVVREVDNVRLFIDHKTAKSLTEVQPTLLLDEQMLHYHLLEWLSDLEGERCDGALYNMLKKVKRSAAAKPPFFERVEVRHNRHELEAFRRRLIGTVTDLLWTTQQLLDGEDPLVAAYPTPTRQCAWDCEFRAVCPLLDDGSRAEDMINSMYVTQNPLTYYESEETTKTHD